MSYSSFNLENHICKVHHSFSAFLLLNPMFVLLNHFPKTILMWVQRSLYTHNSPNSPKMHWHCGRCAGLFYLTCCLISASKQNLNASPLLCCFKQESARFTEQASSILRALSRVVSSFSDEQDQPAARRILEEAHFPQNINTMLGKHHKVDCLPMVLWWYTCVLLHTI